MKAQILKLRLLDVENKKDATGNSAKKLLVDFNGDEEAYQKYQKEQQEIQRKKLDVKIKALSQESISRI